MNKISILPCRIIPCDFGHQIDEVIFNRILQYLNEKKDYKILKKSDNIHEKELVSVKILLKDKKCSLSLYIFSDGIGIFTFYDKKINYSTSNFDVKEILSIRKETHRELLTHCHNISKVINKCVAKIKSLFNKEKSRFTASEKWENKGLSYIMSFYFISCNVELIKNGFFQNKICSLLFPIYDENDDLVDSIENIPFSDISWKPDNGIIDKIRKDFDPLPDIHVCATWTNVLIIGNINKKIINEYTSLEKDLQHVWYYAYITDKIIEQSLSEISLATPEKKLDQIDNILTDMTLKINRYEGIISSTLHERSFHIYNILKTTSRLDVLINSIDKKSSILKERYNRILSSNRNRIETRIQYILIIIALITLLPLFGGLTSFTWFSLLILLFIVITIYYAMKRIL